MLTNAAPPHQNVSGYHFLFIPTILKNFQVYSCRAIFLITGYLCPIYQFLYSVRLEEGTVGSLLEEKGTVEGVQYKSKDGQEMTANAPLTIVCDGCHSNLTLSLQS